MLAHRTLAFVALVCCVAALALSARAQRKIVFDTDPGTDDAAALLLALQSPELEIQAVTVVPGNVTRDQGVENALKLVSLAGRCDIPVAAGAERPVLGEFKPSVFWHGRNGLGNAELPPARCRADSRLAADLIVELVHRHPGQLTLLPVGPLTNLALAVRQDPSIVPLVKEVILMGGSLSGGNITAAAEANIYKDPEAAQVVFTAGWPVTMVGLDVTTKTVFTRDHLAELARVPGPLADAAAAVLRYRIARSEERGRPGTSMHDPLAVGVAIDPSLVSTECWPVEVETRGRLTRGQTVADRRGGDADRPCARVALRVEAARFLELFLSRLRGR